VGRRALQGEVELTQLCPLVVAVDAVANADRDQFWRLLRPCGAHGQRSGRAEQSVAVENVVGTLYAAKIGLKVVRRGGFATGLWYAEPRQV
jgi:hypothetical protein